MTQSTLFTAGNTPDAPRSDLPDLLHALAADLREVGYSVDGVAELLGPSAYAALDRDQLIPALIVTEEAAHGEARAAALAAVVRFWLLAVPQDPAALDAALPRTRTEGLVALGLAEAPHTGETPETGESAEAGETKVRPAADLRPYAWKDAAAGSPSRYTTHRRMRSPNMAAMVSR